MFDQDDLCSHQQQEWMTFVGTYYVDYIVKCKCNPDECECLSFKEFSYKLLDDLESQMSE